MSRHSPRLFANSRGVTLIACILGILLSTRPLWAEEAGIPILAWIGPPEAETNEVRYRELAAAGFTHNFSSFSNIDAMEKALNVARATGIKQFISIPELHSAPETVAERFKGHPALAGYHLRDEPSAADFPALAKWMTRIQAIDPVHACYINLFPNYANGPQLGTATYKEHLDRFIKEVPVPFISFDHYPVVGNSLRGEWYENLEQVSAAARAAKKPFWAFALAVAHNPYPIAEIEHLRLQVFSNLAYGAQGIQYFTYWTVKSPHWNFHQAPIEVDGKRTVVYDRVKQVNSEIRALAKVFKGAEVLRVGHTGKLPRGATAFEPTFPIKALKTGESGAVVSMLANGDQRVLAIVNRDLRSSMTLAVTFDPAAKISEVTKDGATRPIAQDEFRSELTAGDIRVFTWNATTDNPVKSYAGCVKIFNGENFDSWEADSSTWSIIDGAMRGFAGSSRLAYTKADYGSFRLIFTARMNPVNKDHLGVLFWGDRPADPSKPKIDNAGWIQFMPPHGAMWDYHPPKHRNLPHETLAEGSRDFTKWTTTELLCNLEKGTMRAAVDGVEIARYTHPYPVERNDPENRIVPGPIGMFRHGGGASEYKDIYLEADPKEDRLITVK